MTDPYITDLQQIRELTEVNRDAFEVMGYMVELYEDISDVAIDRIVEEVAAPVRAGLDCTECGNCCRSLQVHVTPSDVEQLAVATHSTVDDVHDAYLTDEGCADIEEWRRFRHQPCSFLSGNMCSVYAHRPETCRAYPEMTDFRWLWETYVEGAKVCPIIYNTLVGMVKRVETL
jgi:Fe-S-cluster containining protein